MNQVNRYEWYEIKTYETPDGRWLAEAVDTTTGAAFARIPRGCATRTDALEALGGVLWRARQDAQRAFSAWSDTVFREDPLREWRYLWRKIIGPFSRRVNP